MSPGFQPGFKPWLQSMKEYTILEYFCVQVSSQIFSKLLRQLVSQLLSPGEASSAQVQLSSLLQPFYVFWDTYKLS